MQEKEENIEIDLEEFQKQREENIKQSNRFCEARIVVGLNEKIPYAHFNSKNVTSYEHAMLMKTLDEMKRGIIARDPIAGIIYSKLKVEKCQYIQKDKKGEKEDGNDSK